MNRTIPVSFRLVLLLSIFLLVTGSVYGQEQNSNYLRYQEPQPPTTSLFSTVAYIFTLLAAFAVVIGLAYFTSRILGKKLGLSSGAFGSRILTVIPLGTNRSLHVVEVAGKVLLLGVTDHSITLLQEITDSEEITKLRDDHIKTEATQTPFDQVFQRQIVSLHNMSRKFPSVFGSNRSSETDQEKR